METYNCPVDKLHLLSKMTEFHAVSDLQHRYGLASRQAVYDRLAALKIKPVSRGKLSTELDYT